MNNLPLPDTDVSKFDERHLEALQEAKILLWDGTAPSRCVAEFICIVLEQHKETPVQYEIVQAIGRSVFPAKSYGGWLHVNRAYPGSITQQDLQEARLRWLDKMIADTQAKLQKESK